jgi:hypothetical protein
MARMCRTKLAAVVLGGWLAAGCGASPGPGRAWTPNPLETPAAAPSGQPQISVTADRAIISWVERAGGTATLKFADRTPKGWSAARVVASGTDWFVNWADVPSVVRLADGSLAAHWLQKSGAGTYSYDVRLAFSTDDGQTWTASVTPHHDGTQTEHGFASLFQAPGAGLGLVWLDGRNMVAGSHEGHEGHEGHGSGGMTLRGATFDPSGRQVAEVEIDDRVCECCPTAVAVTAAGPIAAYRNRDEDEIRDIYVTRLVDGAWTPGVAVHADNWRIPACPVNGPALSARGTRVAIAWFTMADGKGQAFVAFSSDSGATFGAPIRADDEATLGRVGVELLEDGSAAVSWIELAGEGGEFRVRRVADDGERGGAVTVASISSTRTSGYPRMALQGADLLFAWTDTKGDAPRVQAARIPIR